VRILHGLMPVFCSGQPHRPRTVRSWIEKGLLEREKIGNAVFIREDQIEAMLLGPTRRKNGNKIKHTIRNSKNTTK